MEDGFHGVLGGLGFGSRSGMLMMLEESRAQNAANGPGGIEGARHNTRERVTSTGRLRWPAGATKRNASFRLSEPGFTIRFAGRRLRLFRAGDKGENFLVLELTVAPA